MVQGNRFQLSQAAADNYEEHSVPALFAPLAKATLEKTPLPPNAEVLDIACGTGALTREIAAALPGKGSITGTDLNQTMLDVACQKQPDSTHQIRWLAADVASLPFEDQSFDMAFVQQGLQFFPDKAAALAEIHRVLRPSGQLVLTCWREISPFNDAIAAALLAHVSDAAAQKARAPFSFRDGAKIRGLLEAAGFSIAAHETIILQRRFEDLRSQILALPFEKDLREKGEETIGTVVRQTAAALTSFAQDGVFVVPQEAHYFACRRA